MLSVLCVMMLSASVQSTLLAHRSKIYDQQHESVTAAVSGSSKARPLRIIVCGAPASGKGTQCQMLQERYGMVHLSTGDMLREAVAAGTDVGVKAKAFMESGQLVPDGVIIGIVQDRLTESDCVEQGWILDGFPRTVAQAMALEQAGIRPDKVLFLEVPDDTIIQRVVGRRSDPLTGRIYHTRFAPPESDDIASRLVQRADDSEEKVRVRLEAFHEHMKAIEKCYANVIAYTDGTKPKAEVFSELEKALAECRS